MQIKKVGSAYRGGPARYKAQTISRIQDGKYGLGTKQAYKRLRLKAARQDRYWLLVRLQQGEAEKDILYAKLEGEVEVDPIQRESLRKWLTATTKQRRKSWQGWLKHQRGRSGGKLIKWAQRESAEEGYTGLKAEPEGAVQTNSTRLEAAADN